MGWRCAECSIERFAGKVCANTSARITIHCNRFHQWRANLRILEVTENQEGSLRAAFASVRKRRIGTVRREYLDQTLFWTTADLEAKLIDFKHLL
jgi:hypothetical protein